MSFDEQKCETLKISSGNRLALDRVLQFKWLRGRVRDCWQASGTGGLGLRGQGQRCGELIANSD